MSLLLEQALVQRFIDGAFDIGVAYENADYEPTAGSPYAELKTFFNDETPFSLKHSNETDGLMQVILRYPENDYSWTAKAMRDQIKTVFKIGLKLETAQGNLQIIRVSAQEGENENGWYKIVIRFFFTAVLPR